MSKLDINIRKDCFAYHDGKCNALTSLVCKHRNCSFYKTVAQEQKDRKKWGYNVR